LAKRLEELIIECSHVNNWEIHELSIQKDHVHLLIQTRPRENVAKVVQLIKGGSSKVIRREFPKLREFLWGKSLWGDGYFAESIGVKNESLMRAYIRNQNKS
jgi:putative transposase